MGCDMLPQSKRNLGAVLESLLACGFVSAGIVLCGYIFLP